jgi:hypothetical protein
MKIVGRYTTGLGKAHLVGETDGVISSYFRTFGCRMFGTFNVKLENKIDASFLQRIEPSKIEGSNWYWFVRISKEGKDCFGWVKRWNRSTSRISCLEIVTKKLIPKSFYEGELEIELYERWSEKEIKDWAKDLYWWQAFEFSPVKRAQSKFLWDTINIVEWSDCSVLDIGCHYGYHSFQASKFGARVVGCDRGVNGVKIAKVIRDKIIHEDVDFVAGDPGGDFDVILYLSVHHQIDPDYHNLKDKIDEYKLRVKKHLFVELIVPPHFPSDKSMTEADIDRVVGGEVLAKYHHNVRGVRKVYGIRKDLT